jgi:tetratricopeptide (TPR) repeat protein
MLEDAIFAAGRAFDISMSIGDDHGAAKAYHLKGNFLYDGGQYMAAALHFKAAARLYSGNRTLLYINLAHCYLDLGDLRQARRFAKLAMLRDCPEMNDPRNRAKLSWLLGKIEMKLGNLKEAEEHLSSAAETFNSDSDPVDALLVRMDVVSALASSGLSSRATSYARELFPLAEALSEIAPVARDAVFKLANQVMEGERLNQELVAFARAQISRSIRHERMKVSGSGESRTLTLAR